MDKETRLRRAATFDQIPDLYDQGRRAVPAHVFEDLFSQSAIDSTNAKVLEIGCGTGQATISLVRRGCQIVCIEMGANLAALARRKLAAYPQVTIVNARFEDWQPGDLQFDIVFAANAWHWIDPQLGHARAAAALRPAGLLAFTKAHHIFPADCDPFFPAIQPCYEEIGESGMQWPPQSPNEIADSREEIERSGYFDHIQIIRRIHVEEFTAEEYVAMMSTASDHRLMQPAKREHLFSEMRRLIAARPAGRIRRHVLTVLHLARKKP